MEEVIETGGELVVADGEVRAVEEEEYGLEVRVATSGKQEEKYSTSWSCSIARSFSSS
jgi:hypothetical protein